jgi:hypothetical protein
MRVEIDLGLPRHDHPKLARRQRSGERERRSVRLPASDRRRLRSGDESGCRFPKILTLMRNKSSISRLSM